MSNIGRPSKYTPELVQEIAERLSVGEPLAQICRDSHMPHPSTVRDWMAADESISRLIARAREDGFDSIASNALEIADDGRRDYDADEDGREFVNHDHIARARLRVETRLKLLAKWDPKRYGEKLAMEHAGPGGGPVQIQATMTPQEAAEAYASTVLAKPDR
jgi:hypothetical protein